MSERQDLAGVWTVLATHQSADLLEVAPLGFNVAAGDVLAGIDREGRQHLLIPLLPGEAARTNTRGRAVHLLRIKLESREYLSIVCLQQELLDTFTRFCTELAGDIEEADSPAREAYEAYERWRALLADAFNRTRLSEQQVLGLLGELVVLEELLGCGASSDLAYWCGPLNAVHDFRVKNRAIEVKSTLLREGRVVPISNVDQLQEPPAGALGLRHLRFDLSPNGVTLEEMVDRVTARGADGQTLRDVLYQGFQVVMTDLGEYGQRYELAESRFYDVTAAAFPRILRSSFVAGDIPAGTLRISYSIDLTNEPPSPLGPDECRSWMEDFAEETK